MEKIISKLPTFNKKTTKERKKVIIFALKCDSVNSKNSSPNNYWTMNKTNSRLMAKYNEAQKNNA